LSHVSHPQPFLLQVTFWIRSHIFAKAFLGLSSSYFFLLVAVIIGACAS
jgi:hypothetical protein